MTFKEWRIWYREKNWTGKWFIILILIRPIVDNYYWLKDVSPLLSPLNIVGVLTPVMIFLSFASGRMKRELNSGLDPIMRVFGFLVFINCVMLDAANVKLEIFGDSLKYILPILLYFYLKRLIQSYRDLLGILQTFLYACIFPFGVLIYENLFNPIAVEYLAEGRGGGSRIRGGYADVMTYAIYIVTFFMTASYFFLRNVYYKISRKGNFRNIVLAFGICIVGLVSIKHVSTWAVFLAMCALLFSFNLRNARGIVFIIIIFIGILPFFGDQIYDSQIEPLIRKEINVASGENEIESGFNGRIGRWERYFSVWKEMPFYSILFGVPTSVHPLARIMVGNGMHSDILRITFLAGIVGIILYLLFLFGILLKSGRFRPPERYLVICSVICLVLHSVSTLPSQYASYMYFLMSIFCYALLPKSRMYLNEYEKHPDKKHIVNSAPVEEQQKLSA